MMAYISFPPHRLVLLSQNFGIMFALLQMRSLQPPLLPLSVVRPAELPSLLQYCPPQRGSESTLPSRFHPQSGDLQNVDASGPLVLRLETCRWSSNLGSVNSPT